MKIHELEITDLRGIRHVTLKPGGKNYVIWGPNGSGKSAVVDAIDFLFQGRMARLEGAGTGEISTAKHGFHVDSQQSKAVVQAIVSLDGIKGTFSLSRALAKPQVLIFPREHEEQLRPVLEVMRTGQYVLTRREILRFITSTGAERAKWIQILLRLESLETMRSTLVKVAHESKKQATNTTTTVNTEAASAASLIGLEKWDEVSALEAVNALRRELGGSALTTLEPTSLKANITPQSASKPDMQAARLAELLTEAELLQAEAAPDLAIKIDELSRSVTELWESAASVALLRRQHLIECGLEVMPDDGSCPLCGAEWEQGQLTERLTLELSGLSEVASARTKITASIAAVSPSLSAVLRNASGIADLALELRLVSGVSPVHTWAAQLDTYSKALGGVSEDASTLEPLTKLPIVALPPDVMDLVVELRKKTKALNPDITPAQKAWDVLTRLTDCLTRLQGASDDSKTAALVHQRADYLLKSYNEAKNTVLTDLYKAVKSRFVTLYSQLHKDDGEEDFAAVLEQDDAAVKFLVDFYGRGMYPPHALHSEGHQDSMGVCLYLALSEHINKGLIGCTVLDDVVMSIDANHRKSLCRVLTQEFRDHQFIITTHDRSWAQQLRSEGVVTGNGMKHFVGWSVESGPRVSEGDIWKNVSEHLSADDATGAATLLRGGMEEFFADVCERLWASMVYRGNADYTLGDYLPAAYSRYVSLLRKAKASANSWGKRDVVERLTDAESVAQQCYQRTTAEQWATNKGIHYDQWHQLGSADLSDVVDAFKDMCAVFMCPSCNSVFSVSASAAGRKAEAVRCNCQAVNWNLVRDQGAVP
jgi:recombinational DNA repair ATPase RecF